MCAQRLTDDSKLRLYFFDVSSRIIEVVASCNTAELTDCNSTSSKVLLEEGPSSTSGLGAMHWGNSSTDEGHQVRVLFADERNRLRQLVYNATQWNDSPENKGFSVANGSSITTAVDDNNLTASETDLRVFYRDPDSVITGLLGRSTSDNYAGERSSSIIYSPGKMKVTNRDHSCN